MNEKNQENDSLIYEVGFHLLPTVEESELLSQVGNIRSIIEANEGLTLSEEAPKLLVLAYDIAKVVNSKNQKFSKAYFGWVKFEVDPAKVIVIKNQIENLPNILRFLITRTVKENTIHTPKIPMFKKENNKIEEKTEDSVEKPKASAEEIDKSIDELVIEN